MNSTIDNLNFAVIIDDTEFNDQIKKMETEAKRFNTSMSNLLDLKKQAQQWSQKDVENNRRAWQAKVDEARAQEKINKEKIRTEGLQRRINAQIDQSTKGYKTQSRILSEIKSAALGYFSIHGASQLLSSLIRVTGEFELQKTTLAAMIGDLNKAEQIITRIQGLAVESPFQFKELTTYAKQLSAFSVPAEELYETTKMLADISAGLGVGMDRIVLAYGQVRSAAFLRGQEVRQFTEAGIPILDELAKQFSELEGRAVSTGEVFDKISARLVPFEMVAKVFKDMTAEGGKFYNMQEIQAETLRGKISNLKDAYEVMLNEIGSGQTEKIKDVVDWTRKLMTNYEETGRTLASLVVSYGVYKATLIAIELITRSFEVANHKLLNTLKSVGAWMFNNPYALLAAGITAAGLATYRLATHMSDVERIQKSVADSHEDYTQALAGEYSMLESLYAKLELYTEGTLEHDKAKAQIMQKYAPYIEQLRQEGKEVSNLADIYVDLADKIRESIQVRFYDSAMQDLNQVYKDAEEKSQKMLENSIKANQKEYNFTEKDKLALNLYVLGGYDQEKAFEKLSDSAKQYFNDFNVFLNKQRDNMSAAQKAYLEGIDDISDAYQTFQGEVEKTPEQLSKFAETVQNELAKFGATKDNKGKFASLWADNMTEYYAYLKKLREGYEDVQEKIKDVGTTQKANLPDLKKQKEAIEAIAKALGVTLEKETKGKGKSDAQLELESQIDLVKKLQDAYEKLLPFLNDSQMRDTLKKLFPEAKAEWLESFDFSEVLNKLADDLAKYDDEASKRLKASVGKDVASSLASAFKEIETYKKMLDEWYRQDFTIEGEGVSFDISKIVHDLNNQYAQIDQKRIKAQELLKKAQMGDEKSLKVLREIYGEEFWQKYLTDGKQAIEDLANYEKETARKTAQEKVNDLANGYVKEQTKDLNLSDWGDKSLGQVKKIKDAFNEIQNSNIQLDENLVKQITDAGLTIDDFVAKVKESFEKIGEEIDDETLKKIIGLGQEAAKQVLDISSALGELAAQNGNTHLANIANMIGQVGDVFSATLEGFKNGGVAGGIIAGVGTIATKLIQASAAAEELRHNLAMTAIEYEDALERIRYENIQESFDNIFGTDGYGKFKSSVNEAKDALKEISDIGAKIMRWDKIPGVTTISSDLRTGWQKFWGQDKNQFGFNLGDLFDDKGQPLEEKFEELQAYYDAYGEGLSNTEKETVTRLLTEWQRYEDAVTASAEYMSSLFGDVASSMADSFIESFKQSGEAALEYGDIMDNVATNIAKSLIENVLLQNVFTDEIQKSAAEALASGDASGAMAIVESAMDSARDLAPYLQEFLEGLQPYFQMEEGTTALGEGIKGITEDQANLLASYLNAIRADVSYSKTLWIRMDSNLQRIAEMFTSSPSLMEYQAQIAANTYNTAIATQDILSELRSVVTTETGASSIRVYKDN